MAVDMQMTLAAISLLSISLVSVYQTRRLYNTIGTRFYQYANGFSTCIVMWTIPSLLMGLLSAPEYYAVIRGSQYFLRPFGFLALGLMISAMESVKSDSRSMLTNIAFLFSGGLIVGTFSPPAISVSWTSFGWVVDYSMEFEFGRFILFSTVVISAIPLGIRLYRRLWSFFQKDTMIKVLFWSTIVFTSSILIVQPVHTIMPPVFLPLFHPSALVLDIALFVLLATILFHKHPTILFIGAQEISELYIIKQDSGLPLYHFKFKVGRVEGLEILSAFFTGIKHFVKHTLGKGEVESILVGDQEMIVQEGIHTYGILIARQSSELTRKLLRLSIDSFERYYQLSQIDYVEKKTSKEFDKIIERFFEFATI